MYNYNKKYIYICKLKFNKNSFDDIFPKETGLQREPKARNEQGMDKGLELDMEHVPVQVHIYLCELAQELVLECIDQRQRVL